MEPVPVRSPSPPDAPVAVDALVPGPGELGCLLVHGLTGTPAEMMPLATVLAGRHPLWVVRVAGHATAVTDLATTSWHEWYASVRAGADALRAVVPHLVVVGLSMGALLGLHLAAERPADVAGLVLLSPAAAVGRGVVRWLRRPLRVLGALDSRVTPLQAALARVLFGKGGSDIADAAVRAVHPGYRQVPLRALLQLLALQRIARADAPGVTQPVLMIHATQDHTSPVAAAQDLYARLGSRAKRLVLLEESFHVVTVDRERTRVQAEVRAFLDGLVASTAARP